MRFFASIASGILPRLQFRLRTLVIGTSIVAVALAPVRAEIARCSVIEELVDSVTSNQGEIYFDYQLIEEGVVLRQLESTQPSWLRQVLGSYAFAQVIEIRLDGHQISQSTFEQIGQHCPNLMHLSLRATGVNNAMLELVAKCKKVQYLELSSTAVTDAGLAFLAENDELQTLCLEGTQLDGSSFGKLSRLRGLRNITLDNTAVDDNVLAKLADSQSIETLFLAGTNVTDAVIPHLARMKSLNTVSLSRTGVTQAGREQLRKLRPEITQS
jgi:hypothetical protein